MNDKELLKTATSFRKGFLGKGKPDLQCFALSTALQGWLHFLGVNTDLICGDIETGDVYDMTCNHYWLQLPDGRILDATGSQFNDSERNMPEVYLGNKPEWYLIPELPF
jgi:hypothetical protein